MENNLDLNNFGLFLLKSGYLPKKLWTSKNSDIFDSNKFNDILLSFEYNQKISVTEASVKYGDKIQWMNKIFKTDLTLDELHSQYIHYTSTNIPFSCLLNNFIMVEIILKNFYNIINPNNEPDINNIFTEYLIMNDINLYSQLNDKNILGMKQKLELIYEKIKKNSAYNNKEVNRHLICIMFLVSMGSTFSVDNKIPQIKNLMNLFMVYNKIYLNDINVSLILFLSVIICINLCIYSNKRRNNLKFMTFDEYNYNNYFFRKIEPQKNVIEQDDLNEHINLFLFDNDIIKYGGDNFSEMLLFQNCLKIFSIYHLSKNQIKLSVYLTIDTIIETLKSFNDDIVINQANNIQNINFNINNNYKTNNNKIKLINTILLSKNNINKCFSSFNFHELLIKVTNFQEESQVQEINMKYSDLIQKSRKFYIQNSISAFQNNESNKTNINTNTNEPEQNLNENNPSIAYLKKEFNVLYYLLTYYQKNKEIKKNLKFYCFKFRFFKCSIFREPKKEMQLFFDYSSIKEKYLLYYLKDIEHLLFLIKLYQEIINTINEFKSYIITFRVSQSNFRSRHINFFFTIIIKKLLFYIQENKFNRITLYDAKLKIYEDTMLVYIKDVTIKEKTRISSLKEMFNMSIFGNKLKVFNHYLKELAEDWDIIIIGKNIKYHNLIHSKNINILFLNITSDKNDNSIQNLLKSAMGAIPNPNQEIIAMSMNPFENFDIKQKLSKNEYLNIFMYIIKDEDFAEKILKFSEKLKENNSCVLKNKFTLICERFFFEEKIIMNSRIKENTQQIFNCIDNYFLVCDTKKDDEIYKYDLFVNKDYVSLVNYLSQEITTTFLEFINNFISVLSSCTELVLYIFEKKEIDPYKFYFIQKIKRDYFCFEYKKANFFVKKLNSFESLMLLNTKKSTPLLCLLTKEQSTEFEVNNYNFFDLFLRLFLNLNKVVKLNELNENFFEKIHKNFFEQNYENIIIITFSYDAFFIFNDLFINNNYLQISKNDKFENCYIIPYEVESQTKVKNYQKILDFKKSDKLMVKIINIYDYNLTNTFIFNNRIELKMNYSKVEYFLEFQNTTNDAQNSVKTKMKYIYKKLKEKNSDKNKIKNTLKSIKEFYYENNNIYFYFGNTTHMLKFITAYNKQQIENKSRKVDLRDIHN